MKKLQRLTFSCFRWAARARPGPRPPAWRPPAPPRPGAPRPPGSMPPKRPWRRPGRCPPPLSAPAVTPTPTPYPCWAQRDTRTSSAQPPTPSCSSKSLFCFKVFGKIIFLIILLKFVRLINNLTFAVCCRLLTNCRNCPVPGPDQIPICGCGETFKPLMTERMEQQHILSMFHELRSIGSRGSIYCCYMSYQSWRVKISNPITLHCNEPNEGGFKLTEKIYMLAINFLLKQINISSLKPERFHTNLKVKLFHCWLRVLNQLFVTIWYLIKLFSSGDFNFLVVKSCE